MTSWAVNNHEWAQIGQGGNGKVYAVRSPSDNVTQACKVMQYEEGDIQRRVDLAHEEYRRMKRVADHPNVVKVNAFEILESTRQVCIFMEYFPEGDLKQLIATIAESPDPQLIDSNGQLRLRNPAEVTAGLAVSVFFQLCSALEYCETGFLYATSSKSGVWARKPSQAPKNWKALFHRDIKPENILVSTLHFNGSDVIQGVRPIKVKLADFGHAVLCENSRMPSTIGRGTASYLAPEIREVLSRRSTSSMSNNDVEPFTSSSVYSVEAGNEVEWTAACDMFSLGCTMYELMKLEPAFEEQMSVDDAIPTIHHASFEYISKRVYACMLPFPQQRPHAPEMTRRLVLMFRDRARLWSHMQNDPQWKTKSYKRAMRAAEQALSQGQPISADFGKGRNTTMEERKLREALDYRANEIFHVHLEGLERLYKSVYIK